MDGQVSSFSDRHYESGSVPKGEPLFWKLPFHWTQARRISGLTGRDLTPFPRFVTIIGRFTSGIAGHRSHLDLGRSSIAQFDLNARHATACRRDWKGLRVHGH
jgi:hypothetical protein